MSKWIPAMATWVKQKGKKELQGEAGKKVPFCTDAKDLAWLTQTLRNLNFGQAGALKEKGHEESASQQCVKDEGGKGAWKRMGRDNSTAASSVTEQEAEEWVGACNGVSFTTQNSATLSPIASYCLLNSLLSKGWDKMIPLLATDVNDFIPEKNTMTKGVSTSTD